MSQVDVLSFRLLDKQTIEHTDKLQSYTAYMYTFVTEDVKITKEIVTPQRRNLTIFILLQVYRVFSCNYKQKRALSSLVLLIIVFS